MSRHLLAVLGLAISLVISAAPLMADHDDHGHGNGHGNKHNHYADEQGWEKRGDYEYRSYAVGHHPPGWSHGKKTGWGNCGMPPGQAKKYGCRTYVYEGHPYYYYQDEGGQIFVRRPVISIQGGVTIAP
jgi:hypothetical protein